MDEDIDALLEAAFDKKGVSDNVFLLAEIATFFCCYKCVLCYSMLGRVV